MHRRIALALLLALTLLAAIPSIAEDRGDTAILLAAFGTSREQARAAYDTIERLARERFPSVHIRWAYTSSKIRTILAGRGEHLDSPEEALLDLAAQGYRRIAVQSLHIIPGMEFDELRDTVSRLATTTLSGVDLELGPPLLMDNEDLKRTARALLDGMEGQRGPGEALVFMGHGTEHRADMYYAAMQYHLWMLDPLAFLCTVEGAMPLATVLPLLEERAAARVRLAPFMVVAGEHAANDMAGDDPDSLKSLLEAEGVEVEPVFRGMGENPDIASIWLDHLETALDRLEQ